MSKAFHIDIDYKRLRNERDQRMRQVFCRSNPDGYRFNVNNTVINHIYEIYKRANRINGAPSPAQRHRFEAALWKIFKTEYRKMYNQTLGDTITIWEIQKLEECVRCMNSDSAADKLLQLTEKGAGYEKRKILCVIP